MNTILGKQLAGLRAMASLTRQEFSNESGISVPTIANIEEGKPFTDRTRKRVLRAAASLGYRLTDYGIEQTDLPTEFMSGEDRIQQLLEDVGITTLYINGADDSKTPPDIIELVEQRIQKGLTIKHFICEGNTCIRGNLSDYRCVPRKFFTNQVRFIYDDTLAIFGKEQIILIRNAEIAEAERRQMEMLWNLLPEPLTSTAGRRYVQS